MIVQIVVLDAIAVYQRLITSFSPAVPKSPAFLVHTLEVRLSNTVTVRIISKFTLYGLIYLTFLHYCHSILDFGFWILD